MEDVTRVEVRSPSDWSSTEDLARKRKAVVVVKAVETRTKRIAVSGFHVRIRSDSGIDSDSGLEVVKLLPLLQPRPLRRLPFGGKTVKHCYFRKMMVDLTMRTEVRRGGDVGVEAGTNLSDRKMNLGG